MAKWNFRKCKDCPDGKNLVVHGSRETYCSKLKKFMTPESFCSLRLKVHEESSGQIDDNETHEESTYVVDDNENVECNESYHWSRGRLPSYYLDGERYIPEDPRTHPCWSLEENEKFTRLFNEGYSLRQIAKRMNKSIHSIVAKKRHFIKREATLKAD